MGDWISQQFASLTPYMGLLLGLALVISAIGFYRTVYFISIGYAFAIVGMVIAVSLALHQNLSLISILQNVGLLAWGIRLGVYLVQRETKATYRAQLERTYDQTNHLKLPVKFAIWVTVSLLYVAMFSPSLFVLAGSAVVSPVGGVVQLIGVIILFGGLGLESLADKQKADFKAQFPKNFCGTGLYHWVRCPNYLGEILFWVGNWIIGSIVYTTFLQWAISLVGMVCITLIMFGSTKRLERSQEERYGSLAEYQTYIKRVPVLFPYVPIYTLKNIRVFLE